EDPFRWKEYHVAGIAPLGARRRMPRWVGVILAFTLSALATALTVLVYSPQDAYAPLHLTLMLFVEGLGGFFLISLVVAARCSGTVNGEQDRNTWEPVLLTCLEPRDILRGKLRGILQAALPYLLAGAVPLFVAALLSGFFAFGAAVYSL